MKLLLVTGALDCGGAQRVLADMANYWACKGWDVTLATWSGADVQDFYALVPEVERVWLDVASLRRGAPFAGLRTGIRQIRRLRGVLRGRRPDAVLSFIDVSNLYCIFASWGLGMRVVVSERTNPSINFTVGRPWRLLRRIFYSRADCVVAQTADAAKWLSSKCRAYVAVIPNSVRKLPELACTREASIIAVGRLSAEKGFDLLLEAFARVSNEFPQWRLYLLGEGQERAALERLRDRLGLGGRVELPGQVRDVEKWLARAGLVVHPSRREGFPNAVLEAMAMGAAVVCTDCPSGPAELIMDGVNGRLVPVDDTEALSRVMSDLMSRPDLRERLGSEALKVKQRYSQHTIMRSWETCLEPETIRAANHAR